MSGIENRLPDETIRMGYQNFVDPEFWNPRDNQSTPGFVMIEGKPVLNTTTLEELGLEVSNTENDFSDPGARDMLNENNRYRIRRSSAIRTRRRKGKGKRSTKRRNNRFGFKKAFGNLSKGLKKLTGKSRRRIYL